MKKGKKSQQKNQHSFTKRKRETRWNINVVVVVMMLVFTTIEESERRHFTWQDGVKDTEDHSFKVKELQTDTAKLRDAQSHKHIIGIKQTAEDLEGENGQS